MKHQHAIDLIELSVEIMRRNVRLLAHPGDTHLLIQAFDRAADALRGNRKAWYASTDLVVREDVLIRLGDHAGELMAIGNVDAAREIEDAIIALKVTP